ncbi:hypothetical protein HYC85_028789 [Camellia sinensis]|uniref:Retrotransposon gag domain-containing protein n=1 Tax=Camellia sinensis TaxID=4442 RepID=A0A7J7FYF6_CAMSI|nr:hypothetical protein HYC85_028789 [Camellia sinensis]
MMRQLQENVPTGPAPPPVLPQLSKTPTNLVDLPFEFDVDPTALKVSKLEKLFKKSQSVKSIPDIEDGYTDLAVTLPDRFKMPHIDRFDRSGDPMIEVTTRDLKTTKQEPKESFSDFVTRWRARASMMTIRPVDKDQIRIVVRNLQPKLMQKMIVLPLPTFADLHEIGVQIEDAMKQGLIDNEREQPKRAFNRGTNAGTSSAAVGRTSNVAMVTTTTPKTLIATPFTGTSSSSSQTARYAPRGQRTFTPLYMPLSKALGVLIKKGHLKPLEPRPLPEKLPRSHNPARYCAYHQQHGHNTDQCFRLRHDIQDLVDNKVIAPPKKPNVTTNPLPPHNQAPPPKCINLIQTGVMSYNPSIYITPSHLSKPKVLIPEGTDLCMMSTFQTQPESMVVSIEDRTWITLGTEKNEDSELEGSMRFEYNPSGCITPMDQPKPKMELPVEAKISVVKEDEPNQGLDDLVELEEDITNLQFFNKQDTGDVTVNWFDLDGSAGAIGWLSDEPNAIEQLQPDQG